MSKRKTDDYEQAYAAWLREMQARMADCRSGVAMARMVARENKTQIACLKRILRRAQAERGKG
jgi:hypothetical protein